MSELVIVRHYEPEPPEKTAELLSCVYSRLFNADVLERLTRSQRESAISPGDNGKGAHNASGKTGAS